MVTQAQARLLTHRQPKAACNAHAAAGNSLLQARQPTLPATATSAAELAHCWPLLQPTATALQPGRLQGTTLLLPLLQLPLVAPLLVHSGDGKERDACAAAGLRKAVEPHCDRAALVLCVVQLLAGSICVLLGTEAHSAKAPGVVQVTAGGAGRREQVRTASPNIHP